MGVQDSVLKLCPVLENRGIIIKVAYTMLNFR